MALLSVFGGSPEREPVLKDREQILAWLEELARLRTELTLRVHEEDPHGMAATVAQVSEEKGTFTLAFLHQASGTWKEGLPLHLVFPLDGQRFRTTARFRGLGGYLQREFSLPEGIRSAERRGHLRTRFTGREKATVAVLETLFEGIGLSGPLLNLSLGGLAFRVDRAMDIARGRRLAIGGDLMAPGRPLGLVRLQDLPHLPTLECGAVIAHFGEQERGLVAGLAFESLGGFETQCLEKLLAQRIPSSLRGFPRKRRRGELEPGAPDPEAETDLEAHPPPEEDPEEPEDGGADPALEAAAEALSDRELLEIRVAMVQPDRLAALRKRTRKLLLVHPEELDRARLVSMLQVDGYAEIHEARSLVQALEAVRRRPPDALLVWHRVGPLDGLDVIGKLRESHRGGPLPALLLEEGEEVKHRLALKGGKVEGLVPTPVDYEGFLKGLLEKILGLSPGGRAPVE